MLILGTGRPEKKVVPWARYAGIHQWLMLIITLIFLLPHL